jgi:hypothetical protein
MVGKIHFSVIADWNPCAERGVAAAAASDPDGYVDPMSPYLRDNDFWWAKERVITPYEYEEIRDLRRRVFELEAPELACYNIGIDPGPVPGERRCRAVEEWVVTNACFWLLGKKWSADEWATAEWRFVNGDFPYRRHELGGVWTELGWRYDEDAEEHGVVRYRRLKDGSCSCPKLGLKRVPESTIIGARCSLLMSVDEAIAELNATRPAHFK